MSRAAKRLDDVVTIEVPRSALMVAAPPATVTQRNCLEVFGLSRRDYLRLAGVAFPVKKEGKLRVARYADVEVYLTKGADFQEKYHRERPAKSAPKLVTAGKLDLDSLDYGALLHKAGFR